MPLIVVPMSKQKYGIAGLKSLHTSIVDPPCDSKAFHLTLVFDTSQYHFYYNSDLSEAGSSSEVVAASNKAEAENADWGVVGKGGKTRKLQTKGHQKDRFIQKNSVWTDNVKQSAGFSQAEEDAKSIYRNRVPL